MEASPRSDEPHLATVRERTGRPVCLPRINSLSPLVLNNRSRGPAGNRCLGTPVAEAAAMCFISTSQGVTSSPLLAQETVWFSTLIQLLKGQPWSLPKRHDLLSQVWGTLWHSDSMRLQRWVWPLNCAI
ncbi:UNVERIFIED_CONTAM: hypothetical protein FKN15_070288 [Acipenser sinensis]